MAVVSMPANQQQQKSTEGSHESRFSRSSSGGARSSAAGSSRGDMVEIVERSRSQLALCPRRKEFKESISSQVWTLRKCPTLKKLVLVHVPRPSQWIPMMGGKFLASQLESQQVNAYRQQEKQKLDKILDQYESLCKCSKEKIELVPIDLKNSPTWCKEKVHPENKEGDLTIEPGFHF